MHSNLYCFIIIIKISLLSRHCAGHCHLLQGVHVALVQLHLPRHRPQQGGGLPALWPLQAVPHPRGCPLQESGQCGGSRHRAQQPRHLLDGMSSFIFGNYKFKSLEYASGHFFQVSKQLKSCKDFYTCRGRMMIPGLTLSFC